MTTLWRPVGQRELELPASGYVGHVLRFEIDARKLVATYRRDA